MSSSLPQSQEHDIPTFATHPFTINGVEISSIPRSAVPESFFENTATVEHDERSIGRLSMQRMLLLEAFDNVSRASNLTVPLCKADTAKRVFACFNCRNFLVGELCIAHHCEGCVKSIDGFSMPALPYSSTFEQRAAGYNKGGFLHTFDLNWIECAICDQQEMLLHNPAYSLVKEHATCIMKWARLLVLIVRMQVRRAPFLNTSSLNNSLHFQDSFWHNVLLFI